MTSIPPRPGTADEGPLPGLGASSRSGSLRPSHPPGASGLRWFISLLVLALVSAGAFVLGRGSEGLSPTTSAITGSLRRAEPVAPPVEPGAIPSGREPVSKLPPALARVAEASPTVTRNAQSEIDSAPPRTELHLNTQQIRAVRNIAREAEVKVQRRDAPRIALSPKIAPSGQVVQLGAYRSVREAEAAAQLFRYKYRGLLETLPKAVLPYRPKGARQTSYRVQFVTPSQAYSEVTCQRLRAAAKTCIVVY